MDFKELLADYARRNAEEILSHVGPNTPYEHSVTLVAIAQSWNNFAKMLET
jgi:hypothetical protein